MVQWRGESQGPTSSLPLLRVSCTPGNLGKSQTLQLCPATAHSCCILNSLPTTPVKQQSTIWPKVYIILTTGLIAPKSVIIFQAVEVRCTQAAIVCHWIRSVCISGSLWKCKHSAIILVWSVVHFFFNLHVCICVYDYWKLKRLESVLLVKRLMKSCLLHYIILSLIDITLQFDHLWMWQKYTWSTY